jgi:hypothetical protein
MEPNPSKAKMSNESKGMWVYVAFLCVIALLLFGWHCNNPPQPEPCPCVDCPCQDDWILPDAPEPLPPPEPAC